MYSKNTETLMSSEELKAALGKNALGQLNGNILPGGDYMGVRFSRSYNDWAVYDGDHVAGNYYFKTSDGMLRVTINGTATDIDQATLETQIKALPGNERASNFGYLQCFKSAAFDPSYGYHTAGQVVGEDTIAMGPGVVCEAPNSHAAGSNLYIAAGSSYVNVRGAESVMNGSSYVVGAFRDAAINNVSDLLLFGAGSRMDNVHTGAVYGGLETPAYSDLELMWRIAMNVPATVSRADNVNVAGQGNAFWGEVCGLNIDGDNNRVGWFNKYLTELPSKNSDTRARDRMTDIGISGNNNWIGYSSSYVNVRGDGNYIAAGSSNVWVFGNKFNHFDSDSFEGSTYPTIFNHAKGEYGSYQLMTTSEAAAALVDPGSFAGTVIGSDSLVQTIEGTSGYVSYSIVANPSGISQYIGWAKNQTWFSGLNRGTVGGVEDFYQLCENKYEAYPVNHENVLVVGDRNTLPSNTKNVVLWGDDNIFTTATVNNCVFFNRNMCIDGPKYMKVGDEYIEKNIIRGVWWIDTNTEHAGDNGLLTDMNSDYATAKFENAFAFIDSRWIYNGRFFGTVTKSEALSLGFIEGTTTTGGNTLDGISGYIISANWSECQKPDTPMVYTGGLALYGGANEATRNQSGYGVLKLGNMYYHCNDLPAPAYDKTQTYPTLGTEVTYDGLVYKSTYVITTAEEWDSSHWTTTGVNVPDYQRTKTNEFITMHLNGQSTTSAGVFKGSVIMTPGTHCCPYAGFPLIVQERQELDGSFHIGVGKICKEALPDDIGGASTLLYDKVRRFECSYVGITNSLQVREYLDGSQVQYLDPKVIYDPAATATDGTGSVVSTSTDGIMTGASISGHRVFSSDGSYTETMTSGVTLHPKNGELIVLDAACFTASYSNGITCLLEDPGMDEIGNEFYMSVYMGVTGGDTMPCSVTGKMVGMDVNMGTTGVYPGVGTRTIYFKDYIPGNITTQKNAFVRVSVKKVMDTAAYFFEPIPLPS